MAKRLSQSTSQSASPTYMKMWTIEWHTYENKIHAKVKLKTEPCAHSHNTLAHIRRIADYMKLLPKMCRRKQNFKTKHMVAVAGIYYALEHSRSHGTDSVIISLLWLTDWLSDWLAGCLVGLLAMGRELAGLAGVADEIFRRCLCAESDLHEARSQFSKQLYLKFGFWHRMWCGVCTAYVSDARCACLLCYDRARVMQRSIDAMRTQPKNPQNWIHKHTLRFASITYAATAAFALRREPMHRTRSSHLT